MYDAKTAEADRQKRVAKFLDLQTHQYGKLDVYVFECQRTSEKARRFEVVANDQSSAWLLAVTEARKSSCGLVHLCLVQAGDIPMADLAGETLSKKLY